MQILRVEIGVMDPTGAQIAQEGRDRHEESLARRGIGAAPEGREVRAIGEPARHHVDAIGAQPRGIERKPHHIGGAHPRLTQMQRHAEFPGRSAGATEAIAEE